MLFKTHFVNIDKRERERECMCVRKRETQRERLFVLNVFFFFLN